ncbi:hypothetical protein PC9H_011202 [Pleurotus ostreatus]|uniref:Uncharacterized protein n=2 Tax=Pleurotus ostreatus TaxID=5322 RepID=A0A067NBG8_PLEO1|nr:uncharacterized protein PC9H_011202 [Pleurotus ostreatus]KAF7423038.1 hypothetical protein PC9H_011202 [Pleurotus ostreatus]KDQ25199.1 hypothetical protein PLEOSDRAFT_159855 [Pleurotus ostreatus PC15]
MSSTNAVLPEKVGGVHLSLEPGYNGAIRASAAVLGHWRRAIVTMYEKKTRRIISCTTFVEYPAGKMTLETAKQSLRFELGQGVVHSRYSLTFNVAKTHTANVDNHYRRTHARRPRLEGAVGSIHRSFIFDPRPRPHIYGSRATSSSCEQPTHGDDDVVVEGGHGKAAMRPIQHPGQRWA